MRFKYPSLLIHFSGAGTPTGSWHGNWLKPGVASLVYGASGRIELPMTVRLLRHMAMAAAKGVTPI